MKIGIFSIPEVNPGKRSIKDGRLDEINKFSQAKKKTYLQLDFIGEEALLESDMILLKEESRADLILKDLEFVETRLGRAEQDNEKKLLEKLKNILEKEEFVYKSALTEEEKASISAYGLMTNRPTVFLKKEELEDLDNSLSSALRENGFISFFTSNEKESRAWLIKQGISAWEAAGLIHSDIQKGFIRAEVISFSDLTQAGGINQAKQAGKMRLEQKEYRVQDADLINFRFNK
ncbi:MAG: hypothetical protein DRP74_03245 [Candidatus Omnitrophota bacterium]|nr:MAG: hypothetical protein DRP74_03245 [Candidatus Omnitrophota bacterium]